MNSVPRLPATAGRSVGRRSVRFSDAPRPARWAVITGGVGAVIGLVVGLVVYPPTAVFAALELGVSSALLGGLAGGFATLALFAYRRMR